LFVDLVGFTAWGERATPDEVIALLREFHARMVAAVFAHGGTVDKYLGDGLMVTFGTPHPGERDARRARARLRPCHARRDDGVEHRACGGRRGGDADRRRR